MQPFGAVLKYDTFLRVVCLRTPILHLIQTSRDGIIGILAGGRGGGS